MVIRGRAPLRVSFGGGGTDVAPFCVEQGGAIIGSTINKYAYCSIVPRTDDQIIVHSLDFDMTVKYNTREIYVYDGRLDLVTAALMAMDIRAAFFTLRWSCISSLVRLNLMLFPCQTKIPCDAFR